jgi:protein phosphatase
VDPQLGAVAHEPGDIFLLCTDGLIKGLRDDHLLELLRPGAQAKQSVNPARLLVETAVENDGTDNTTAMVIQMGPAG